MGDFTPTTNPLTESVDLPPDRNPRRVYLARLASGSQPTMADALESIAEIASGGRVEADRFPWHRLRYQHTQAVRAVLMEAVSGRTAKPLSPATINKALSSPRGVLREAWRLGLMSAEDLARATDLAPVRGSVPLRGRALEPGEVVRLFQACMDDPTPAGPRDAAILALGLGAALRRAEIVRLDLANVDLGRELVRVHGKGRKVRDVPVKSGTLEALREWLQVRGCDPGPLLYPIGKGGRIGLLKLSPQAVQRVCEKRGSEAGVGPFAAHDLRRTYISTLLNRGVDLSVASDLAGHASPNTTRRYDRRGEHARHSAALAAAVPFTSAL